MNNNTFLFINNIKYLLRVKDLNYKASNGSLKFFNLFYRIYKHIQYIIKSIYNLSSLSVDHTYDK